MKGDEITISSERSVRYDFLEMVKFILGSPKLGVIYFGLRVAYKQITFEIIRSDEKNI
jgi:hypothetical protein